MPSFSTLSTRRGGRLVDRCRTHGVAHQRGQRRRLPAPCRRRRRWRRRSRRPGSPRCRKSRLPPRCHVPTARYLVATETPGMAGVLAGSRLRCSVWAIVDCSWYSRACSIAVAARRPRSDARTRSLASKRRLDETIVRAPIGRSPESLSGTTIAERPSSRSIRRRCSSPRRRLADRGRHRVEHPRPSFPDRRGHRAFPSAAWRVALQPFRYLGLDADDGQTPDRAGSPTRSRIAWSARSGTTISASTFRTCSDQASAIAARWHPRAAPASGASSARTRLQASARSIP